jgi:hypothetical protein
MAVWFLLFFPLCAAASGSDSLPFPSAPSTPWKTSAGLSANFSQTGYSTAAIATMRYKRLALSAGGKIVVSKTYLLFNAPYGLVTGISFFPGGNANRFSGFMNLDYQITFQGNNHSENNIPGHRVHEYTFGYGFTYSAARRVDVLSAINFGRYTEVMINQYTGERVSFTGFNSLLRLGVNYTFGP